MATRGAGGRYSGLAPLVAGTDAVWIAATLSDADRTAAERGVIEADGIRARTLRDRSPDARPGLRRRLQLDALVPPSHAARSQPASRHRCRFPSGVGLLPGLQPRLRRCRRRRSTAGRGRAGAGLPPLAARATAARRASRSPLGPLLPHAVRAAASDPRASPRPRRRVARGNGRPRCLRVPLRPLGRRLPQRLPRDRRHRTDDLRLAARARRRRHPGGGRLRALPGRGRADRRRPSRPPPDRSRRPDRVVEEPAAGVPGLRHDAAGPTRPPWHRRLRALATRAARAFPNTWRIGPRSSRSPM